MIFQGKLNRIHNEANNWNFHNLSKETIQRNQRWVPSQRIFIVQTEELSLRN